MARFENKKMIRSFDKETGADIFTTDRGKSFDLSEVKVLASGVDTIRQLYNCTLIGDVFRRISTHFEKSSSRTISIGGIDWLISTPGKTARYKYILKNLEEGFVVLLKSHFCKSDEKGAHLKIEATPQVIDKLGLCGLTKRLREIARLFSESIEAAGVAVHLYADIKGLDIPNDFEHRLAARCSRRIKYNTISDGNLVGSDLAVVYGEGETYLFGEPTRIQMCLYNKSKEAIKSRKIGFMEEVWKRKPSITNWLEPEYNDGQETGESDTIYRLEFRIHHSVVREFEYGNCAKSATYDDEGKCTQPGTVVGLREARDLKKHLKGFWDYCLENFRLEHSRTYVDPIWQKLKEDVEHFKIHPTFIYARSQKDPNKKEIACYRRNIAMHIGNYIRVAAHKGLKAKEVTKYLLDGGLDSYIADYLKLKSFGNRDEIWLTMLDFVTEKLKEHRLNGVAA